jgi:hypothetical protein
MNRLSIAYGLALLFAFVAITTNPGGLVAQSQGPATSEPAANSLNVPDDTTFLAALTTPIGMDQAKPNDTVEVVTSQDIKKGHDVVLKKGATLLGRVDWVDAATVVPTGPHRIVITFDRLKAKKSEQEIPFHVVIQALAPKSDVETDSVPFATGRGMQGATADNLPSGHASATQGSVNVLTPSSHGVQDLPGLDLSERIADNKHATVLSASRKDIQLKKGTQLVMKVVSQ